jgi:hypothetical protein
MNKARAAEILLENKPWMSCRAGCNGGWLESSNTGRLSQACQVCEGYGLVLRPQHRHACRLLGEPLPQHPPPAVTLQEQGRIFNLANSIREAEDERILDALVLDELLPEGTPWKS